MRTRCPSCGATLSLDALVAHEGAREALATAFKLSGTVGAALVRYLSLFRPEARELTMDRVGKLLAEVLPDIQAGRIMRNGQVYEAPQEAWVWAIEQGLAARDAGRLKTPLKGHGWLYEVIANYRPTVTNRWSMARRAWPSPRLRRRPCRASLRWRASNMVADWFRAVIATGLQKLLALRLAGTPPEDAIVGTAEVWLEAIWNNGCQWDEHLDRERMERAFLVLFRICDRWPPPKLYLDNLGARAPPRQLPPPRSRRRCANRTWLASAS